MLLGHGLCTLAPPIIVTAAQRPDAAECISSARRYREPKQGHQQHKSTGHITNRHDFIKHEQKTNALSYNMNRIDTQNNQLTVRQRRINKIKQTRKSPTPRARSCMCAPENLCFFLNGFYLEFVAHFAILCSRLTGLDVRDG